MRNTIVLLNNLAFVAFTFGTPFLYALRTRKRGKTILLAWGVFVGWFFVQAFVLIPLSNRYDRSMGGIFSDGPAVIAAVFTGPFWGLIVLVLGGLTRYMLARFWPAAFRSLCVFP